MAPIPGPANTPNVKVMGLALLFGATAFTVVALAMPWIAPHDGTEPPDVELIELMSLVNLVLFVSLLPGAFYLPARLAAFSATPVATRRILRWALLEGAALFGAVVLLLAALLGVLPGQPVYYLNVVPYLAFAFLLIGDLVNPVGLGGPPK